MKTENYRLCNMRLPAKEKQYWHIAITLFVDNVKKQVPECAYIELGKQDTRGGFSICVYKDNHCVKIQRMFENKDQLLGFILGYNQAGYGGL